MDGTSWTSAGLVTEIESPFGDNHGGPSKRKRAAAKPASSKAVVKAPAAAPSPSPSPALPVATATRTPLRAELPKYMGELYGKALRLTRNTAAANDLVQDTCERAMKFEAQYNQGTNLRAWLSQILFSVFVSGYRRKKRERRALEGLEVDPVSWVRDASTPEAVMKAFTPSLERELAQLPAGFRHVLLSVDVLEHSYKDAAEELGIPIGTVMSRLHRARRVMADAVGHDPR